MSFWAMAGKEVRDILREKTISVAIVIQLFIAAFSTFLTVGLTVLYDPSSAQAHPVAEVAYLGDSGFENVMAQTANLHVHHDPPNAMQGFQNGTYGLVVQETVDDAGAHNITVVVPDGEVQSTLLVTQMRDLLQSYERDLRQANQGRLVHHVLGPIQPLQQRGAIPYPFVYGTLLPLLVATPVLLSGAIAGDALAQEVESRTLLLLRASPLPVRRILWAKIFVPAVLAPLQVLLWIGLLRLNRVHVANLPLIVLLTVAMTVILAGIGFSLAARLKKDGPTQAAYALMSIALAVASLFLPHDPLNLVARLATGNVDGAGVLTLVLLSAFAVACGVLGVNDAASRIRRDLL